MLVAGLLVVVVLKSWLICFLFFVVFFFGGGQKTTTGLQILFPGGVETTSFGRGDPKNIVVVVVGRDKNSRPT